MNKYSVSSQIRYNTQIMSIEMARAAAEITLGRIENYNRLHFDTLEESDVVFNSLTLNLWDKFAVHGTVGKKPKTEELVINRCPDADGRCAVGLLNEAGFNTEDIKYLAPGDYSKDRINLDTGGRSGVVVEGRTAFFDHHGRDSNGDTSTTAIVYETLVDLGLLESRQGLDRLAKFITQTDNQLLPITLRRFVNSWRTIEGQSKFLSFGKLMRYFDDPESPEPTEPIDKDEFRAEHKLMGLGLTIKKIDSQKLNIENSLQRLRQMRKSGLIIPSNYYGEIAVDIGGKVTLGSEAARAFMNGGLYLRWGPDGDFFVSSSVPIPITHQLPQGKPVRGTMWVRDREIPTTMTLATVLQILTDGRLESTEDLAKYLEEEKG